MGVRSPNDSPLDLAGVLGRSSDFLHVLPPDSLLTSGDGNGVRSVIAAKYGEASIEAVLGETDEAILEVDRVDRSELPMIGRVVGEARLCNRPGSVVGVSKKTGVSFNIGAVASMGVGMFVLICSPAEAGVIDLGLR